MLPYLQNTRSKTKQQIVAFRGLNLTENHADGEIVSRTKEVIIPAAGTLNTWVEVDELPVETASDEDTAKAEKISELEAEIANLKGE